MLAFIFTELTFAPLCRVDENFMLSLAWLIIRCKLAFRALKNFASEKIIDKISINEINKSAMLEVLSQKLKNIQETSQN